MSEIERGIRTELRHSSNDAHAGFGAGPGDTERYDYYCPCGKGSIIEEHDNIPGSRDRDVYMTYGKDEWDFVPNLSHHTWQLDRKTA